MRTSNSVVVAAAVAAGGFGLSAVSASAVPTFSPLGQPYVGVGLNAQTSKIGATGPTVSCSMSSFTGTTSTSPSGTTTFSAHYSGTGSGGSCPAGPLGNVDVSVVGDLSFTVSGGTGPFPGFVSFLPGSVITVTPKTVPSCHVTVTTAGNGFLTGLSAVNTGSSGVRVYGTIGGIEYTASSGCPGVASGTRADATYSTGGTSASGGVSGPSVSIVP